MINTATVVHTLHLPRPTKSIHLFFESALTTPTRHSLCIALLRPSTMEEATQDSKRKKRFNHARGRKKQKVDASEHPNEEDDQGSDSQKEAYKSPVKQQEQKASQDRAQIGRARLNSERKAIGMFFDDESEESEEENRGLGRQVIPPQSTTPTLPPSKSVSKYHPRMETHQSLECYTPTKSTRQQR